MYLARDGVCLCFKKVPDEAENAREAVPAERSLARVLDSLLSGSGCRHL